MHLSNYTFSHHLGGSRLGSFLVFAALHTKWRCLQRQGQIECWRCLQTSGMKPRPHRGTAQSSPGLFISSYVTASRSDAQVTASPRDAGSPAEQSPLPHLQAFLQKVLKALGGEVCTVSCHHVQQPYASKLIERICTILLATNSKVARKKACKHMLHMNSSS